MGPEVGLVIACLFVNIEQEGGREGGSKSSALDPTPTGLAPLAWS